MRERTGNFEKVPKVAYSPQEAAYALGLGRTKTYALINEGRLAAIRIGRRLLVPAEAIQEFLRRQAAEQEEKTQ